MNEPTYNLFLYVEHEVIKELGVVIHNLEGTEEEKLSALRSFVDQDYKIAKRYSLQGKIEWQHYQALMRLGRELEVFEQIMRDCSAPINPLVVITCGSSKPHPRERDAKSGADGSRVTDEFAVSALS